VNYLISALFIEIPENSGGEQLLLCHYWQMRAISAYARAAHFGPTMLITAISFLLALRLWWEGPAYVIAFTVFLGQLLIGWSNDIYDYQDDLKHNRVNKPLVSGQLKIEKLRRATFILLPFAVITNLLGPLGLKGGAVYLLVLAAVLPITSILSSVLHLLLSTSSPLQRFRQVFSMLLIEIHHFGY